MKIKELIEKLQGLDQEMEVWSSIDAEGNGFHPCCGDYSISYIDPSEDSYDAEPYNLDDPEDEEYHASDFDTKEEYLEWKSSLKKIIVLWP